MVNIDKMQFAIVPGRDTTDAIFIVRQLQEKYIATANKPLYFAFVDLEKAFSAKKGPVVGLEEPECGRMDWACHPGHVPQCQEPRAGQWSIQWGVWHGSWYASGLCP